MLPVLKEVVPGNLIVFVGRKLEVRKAQSLDEYSLDNKFEARFEVLSVIFGSHRDHEIRFTAYDHLARDLPGFARQEVVLLYVSRYEGRLFHEKYQYDLVYPTRDGRWAGCGTSDRAAPQIRLHPIDFAPEARSGCTEGLYAEELFEARRRGVLRARGLFQ